MFNEMRPDRITSIRTVGMAMIAQERAKRAAEKAAEVKQESRSHDEMYKYMMERRTMYAQKGAFDPEAFLNESTDEEVKKDKPIDETDGEKTAQVVKKDKPIGKTDGEKSAAAEAEKSETKSDEDVPQKSPVKAWQGAVKKLSNIRNLGAAGAAKAVADSVADTIPKGAKDAIAQAHAAGTEAAGAAASAVASQIPEGAKVAAAQAVAVGTDAAGAAVRTTKLAATQAATKGSEAAGVAASAVASQIPEGAKVAAAQAVAAGSDAAGAAARTTKLAATQAAAVGTEAAGAALRTTKLAATQAATKGSEAAGAAASAVASQIPEGAKLAAAQAVAAGSDAAGAAARTTKLAATQAATKGSEAAGAAVSAVASQIPEGAQVVAAQASQKLLAIPDNVAEHIPEGAKAAASQAQAMGHRASMAAVTQVNVRTLMVKKQWLGPVRTRLSLAAGHRPSTAPASLDSAAPKSDNEVNESNSKDHIDDSNASDNGTGEDKPGPTLTLPPLSSSTPASPRPRILVRRNEESTKEEDGDPK